MTTPFSSIPAAYPGATPTGPDQWPSRSTRVWLGPVGNMIELPMVSQDGLSAPPSRGEVVKGLWGGGTSVLRFPNATRSWTLNWPSLIGREWQIITAFHRDLFGMPPWCLVMQDDVNKLTGAQSLCSGAGWTASNGTVTTSTASPVITPCGVMQWATTSGSRLVAGSIVSTVSTPDANYGVPNLPAEFLTFSAWVWLASGTGSMHARLTGCNSDGSSPSAVNGPSIAIGTTPVEVPVTATPLAFGSLDWVLPVLVADSASTFLISNPQVSFTSCPVEWEIGSGVPRVVPTGPPTRDLALYPSNAATWALAEAYPGAC